MGERCIIAKSFETPIFAFGLEKTQLLLLYETNRRTLFVICG